MAKQRLKNQNACNDWLKIPTRQDKTAEKALDGSTIVDDRYRVQVSHELQDCEPSRDKSNSGWPRGARRGYPTYIATRPMSTEVDMNRESLHLFLMIFFS